jgi:putative endonuclease
VLAIFRPCHPEWSEAESNLSVERARSGISGEGDEAMYFTYILTNKSNSVMYIGVTNDLRRRIYEYKNEQVEGFTKKYRVHKLIYFEEYSNINDAIKREKQLKRWVRIKKLLG